MKKTEKLLNDIVETYDNNSEVKKAADELLEAVAKPKTFKASYTSDLPFEIKNYRDWYFNDTEFISFVNFATVDYQNSMINEADFCEDEVKKDISALHNFMLRWGVQVLINDK